VTDETMKNWGIIIKDYKLRWYKNPMSVCHGFVTKVPYWKKSIISVVFKE